MTELSPSTWREVQDSFSDRTIAILPLGALEPHGPHLPLDTDVRIATACAKRAAALIEAAGVPTIVLPPLPYGITRAAQDYTGGVTLRPGTLWSFVEDLVLSLQQDDIRQLALANGHHEGEHTRILSNLAADYVTRGPGCCQLLFPDGAAAGLEEHECHGGRRETSLMLAVAPESVRRERLAELPAVDLGLGGEGQALAGRSLRDLGAEEGYHGDPASASLGEGEALLEELAAGIVGACRSSWPDLFESTDAGSDSAS